MRRAGVVALNTFREAVRDRVLYNLVFFALLMMAIFIGVGLVYKEMDKRTLYALLAKPVRRWEFLLGKFGGLVLTLTVNTAAMAAGLFLVLWYVKHSLASEDSAVLVAVYFILLKLALVVALAMLFSCFTTPLLSILFTAGLY